MTYSAQGYDMLLYCKKIILFISTVILIACGSSSSSTEPQQQSYSQVIIQDNDADDGNFDPSFASNTSSRVWMSYSAVAKDSRNNILKRVSTRLAYSDDGGDTWIDTGTALNDAETIILPAPNASVLAVRNHEVSNLLFDTQANSWVLLWHNILTTLNPGAMNAERLFEHSWISMKTLTGPDTSSTIERKLFVGSLYDSVNDVVIGAPEFPLHSLYPTELGSCLAFTEPTLFVDAASIYLAMKCSFGVTGGKIILLQCDNNFSSCNYRGDFINDTDASNLSSTYNGFSAPEFFEVNNTKYLILTPTEGNSKLYKGCLVFAVSNLNSANLVTENGSPKVFLTIPAEGDFSGACDYHDLLDNGIMFGQAFLSAQPVFRLFDTHLEL